MSLTENTTNLRDISRFYSEVVAAMTAIGKKNTPPHETVKCSSFYKAKEC